MESLFEWFLSQSLVHPSLYLQPTQTILIFLTKPLFASSFSTDPFSASGLPPSIFPLTHYPQLPRPLHLALSSLPFPHCPSCPPLPSPIGVSIISIQNPMHQCSIRTHESQPQRFLLPEKHGGDEVDIEGVEELAHCCVCSAVSFHVTRLFSAAWCSVVVCVD